jgi:hypothetical protein
MTITKYTCDKCDNSIESKCFPEGWQRLSVNLRYSKSRDFDICPACCATLKIEHPSQYIDSSNLGERLVEILSEIAQESVQR